MAENFCGTFNFVSADNMEAYLKKIGNDNITVTSQYLLASISLVISQYLLAPFRDECGDDKSGDDDEALLRGQSRWESVVRDYERAEDLRNQI